MSDPVLAVTTSGPQPDLKLEASVYPVRDFEVTGDGSHIQWERCPWHPLVRVGNGAATYATRVKFLYSPLGIYFLFHCEDRKLSVTPRQDFEDIFNEDVIELFLWPDQSQRLYFEYELSPLGVELPILVANNGATFMGWQPWKYAERPIRKATSVTDGEKECGAAVSAWSAELFIPFALLHGLGNSHPTRGSVWRANMYRIDHDEQPSSQWAWCPDTQGNFHDYTKFGTLKFL